MLNMQFDKLVVVETADIPWQPGSSAGSWRKPLAHGDTEQGPSTSIMRYEAGAQIPPQQSTRGEEIFVLDGQLADEHGEYPAGTYLRNPAGSQPAPHSHRGCELLVKLDQIDSADETSLSIDTNQGAWLPGEVNLKVMPLHYFDTEMVALYKWPADTRVPVHQHFGGEEFFVLNGVLFDEYGRYPAGTWVRFPHLSEHYPCAEEDTVIWIKSGHLLP